MYDANFKHRSASLLSPYVIYTDDDLHICYENRSWNTSAYVHSIPRYLEVWARKRGIFDKV